MKSHTNNGKLHLNVNHTNNHRIRSTFNEIPVKNVKTSRPSTKLSEQKRKVLEQARDDVKAGKMTTYGAAKKYNIPTSTLWQWCNRSDGDEGIPTVGRPCYLGSHLENKLKSWILEAVQTGIKTY